MRLRSKLKIFLSTHRRKWFQNLKSSNTSSYVIVGMIILCFVFYLAIFLHLACHSWSVFVCNININIYNTRKGYNFRADWTSFFSQLIFLSVLSLSKAELITLTQTLEFLSPPTGARFCTVTFNISQYIITKHVKR